MEQQIKFAPTPDGQRVAYALSGSGPLLMHVIGWPFSHLREELKVPPLLRYYEVLASHGTLVRLNMRGSGMSPRTGSITPDGMVADIIAVLDAIGVASIDMIGYGPGGYSVMRLAAQFPERVRKLCSGIRRRTTPLNPPPASSVP